MSTITNSYKSRGPLAVKELELASIGLEKTLLTQANFLPSGGTLAALTANLINPTTYSNTLAGQVVALKLTVGFDNTYSNFSSSRQAQGSFRYSE